MNVHIDPDAGFCYGVNRAIGMAEKELEKSAQIYSLGQIVHNDEEEQRLQHLGMKTITHKELETLTKRTMLIRAHGEPPSTYNLAKENQINLIDATCPIVKKLQENVKKAWLDAKENDGQIVIVGKKDHPEVMGLVGCAGGEAIVVENTGDIAMIDFRRPVHLFAQTTADEGLLLEIASAIGKKYSPKEIEKPEGDKNIRAHSERLAEKGFVLKNTICPHVKNRKTRIVQFAGQYDLIIFVGGKYSSNARFLSKLCQTVNPQTYFVENEEMLQSEWFENVATVGITGATSTPPWLLKGIERKIVAINNEK
jgi:4-hydroxy-3-methylbut-2-en-1-yl diphosphate reductase